MATSNHDSGAELRVDERPLFFSYKIVIRPVSISYAFVSTLTALVASRRFCELCEFVDQAADIARCQRARRQREQPRHSSHAAAPVLLCPIPSVSVVCIQSASGIGCWQFFGMRLRGTVPIGPA